MDKGLDIAERRCVLAFHAAAPDSRRKLAKFSREFVLSRTSGASLEAPLVDYLTLRKSLIAKCRGHWPTEPCTGLSYLDTA